MKGIQLPRVFGCERPSRADLGDAFADEGHVVVPLAVVGVCVVLLAFYRGVHDLHDPLGGGVERVHVGPQLPSCGHWIHIVHHAHQGALRQSWLYIICPGGDAVVHERLVSRNRGDGPVAGLDELGTADLEPVLAVEPGYQVPHVQEVRPVLQDGGGLPRPEHRIGRDELRYQLRGDEGAVRSKAPSADLLAFCVEIELRFVFDYGAYPASGIDLAHVSAGMRHQEHLGDHQVPSVGLVIHLEVPLHHQVQLRIRFGIHPHHDVLQFERSGIQLGGLVERRMEQVDSALLLRSVQVGGDEPDDAPMLVDLPRHGRILLLQRHDALALDGAPLVAVLREVEHQRAGGFFRLFTDRAGVPRPVRLHGAFGGEWCGGHLRPALIACI